MIPLSSESHETDLYAALDVKLDDDDSRDREGDQEVSRVLLPICKAAVALDEALAQLLEAWRQDQEHEKGKVEAQAEPEANAS